MKLSEEFKEQLLDFINQEFYFHKNGMITKRYFDDVHFWWMNDNHTFIQIETYDLQELTDRVKQLIKEHPYGMLCQITMLKGGQEVKRAGECAHFYQEEGKDRRNLVKWLNALQDIPGLMDFLEYKRMCKYEETHSPSGP